jgi:hypothetical protein
MARLFGPDSNGRLDLVAYPGNKAQPLHRELLQSLNLPNLPIVVDAFYGSGGFSKSYLQTHEWNAPHYDRIVIAGESFEPLRKLYSNSFGDTAFLKSLANHFLNAIGLSECGWDSKKLTIVWESLRDGLEGKVDHLHSLRDKLPEGTYRFHSPQSLLILQNLGIGNNIRHNGSGRHNIKPCPHKIRGLIKRGRFLNPINHYPDRITSSWENALKEWPGPDSIALLDPPYFAANSKKPPSQTYPNENATLCGAPPVERAMILKYGAIVAFNNFSYELDKCFALLAHRHGYHYGMRPTGWKTKFKQTEVSTEHVWVFTPIAQTHSLYSPTKSAQTPLRELAIV